MLHYTHSVIKLLQVVLMLVIHNSVFIAKVVLMLVVILRVFEVTELCKISRVILTVINFIAGCVDAGCDTHSVFVTRKVLMLVVILTECF